MATMPPVPAHRLAWRGTPWLLEIQRDGASRLRLTSHSNEYVGLLRERLAQQIGCGLAHVRMFCLGELRLRLRGSPTLNLAQHHGIDARGGGEA
jgi:hypothetical protein